MRIGSLFSGIGGLELGLERAGFGPTVWQVEKNAQCRDVLARHWPEAVRHEDVHDVGASILTPVELVCGGFPCNDISSAGGRTGLAGPKSGLWYEFARIVGELCPDWVVVENVQSGADRWVDRVRGDLAELGYASLPVPLQARDVGAPHRRARVFLVAHTHEQRQQAESASRLHARGQSGHHLTRRRDRAFPPGPADAQAWRAWRAAGRCEPVVRRKSDGLCHRMDRLRMLGNAVVPECAEVIGHIINTLQKQEQTKHGS